MKKITLNDIAQESGVSVATVTRVIHNNGYVSLEKRARIEQAIERLGYAPPQRSQRAEKGRLVAIVLPPSNGHPFSSRLGYALESYAYRAGLLAMTLVDVQKNDTIPALLKIIMEQNVCGIVLAGFSDVEMSEKTRSTLLECGVPVVTIERAKNCGLNCVQIDTENGLYMATCHMLDRGHRNLIYLSPPITGEVERERLHGFRRGLEENNIPFSDDMVKICKSLSPEQGYEAVKEALQRRPDINGIVTWSDMYACGALQCLRRLGKSVPEDVAVIGYDDFMAPLLTPPLSSIRSPLEEMAQAAIETILTNQNQSAEFFARTIILSPKLVVRAST